MAKTASVGRVKVTLVRSTIGFDKRQANVVRATFTGLEELKNPAAVARLRGVDLEHLTA